MTKICDWGVARSGLAILPWPRRRRDRPSSRGMISSSRICRGIKSSRRRRSGLSASRSSPGRGIARALAACRSLGSVSRSRSPTRRLVVVSRATPLRYCPSTAAPRPRSRRVALDASVAPGLPRRSRGCAREISAASTPTDPILSHGACCGVILHILAPQRRSCRGASAQATTTGY